MIIIIMLQLLGMLTDIQINPDNKFSGYIRIINYSFIIRQHGGSFFSYTFRVVFQNFNAILQKFCTLIRVYPKISGWT